MAPLDPSPLFLIGFMATGKTTVGRLVAERLGRRFVDLDEEIARGAGRSIPEIFREDGEAALRRLEAAALAEVAGRAGLGAVIACGGGTPCFGDNLARMRAAGVVVALRASIDEVVRRSGAADARPLLAGAPAARRAEAERLSAAREGRYRGAHLAIETDGRTPEQVADECSARARLRLGAAAVRLGGGDAGAPDRSYPVHLAPVGAIRELAAELLSGVARVALVTDEHVADAGHARAVHEALTGAGRQVVEVVVPAGEGAKSLGELGRVASACVAAGLDRTSGVVAVGGGVVSDLAGLAAAVLCRGVPWAVVPTTLLAMVDAAIGGKTGVDLPEGKNLVGAFWQPRFVLADLTTLATLPERELAAAFGEVVKVGLLGDPELFAAVEAGGRALDLEDAVLRCARLKAQVVSADERETCVEGGTDGGRARLNLGHTLGHAIEAASLGRTGGGLRHGEAVALGLIAAARVSRRLGLCDAGLEGRIAGALARAGLDVALDPWLRPEVLAYVRVDKKRAGGLLRFVALEEVGRPRIVELPPAELATLLRSPGP